MTNLSPLNPQQRLAVVSDDPRVLVLAGAGSGKTKTLLQKIIYLIEEKGVSPLDILAITFTKNAANEMLDRLILTAEPSGAYTAILHDKKKRREEKEKARRDFVRRFKWIEGLTMRTFHSFGYSLLRTYGANEFDNKFRIITEDRKKEEDEFSRYIAPESGYEIFYKLLLRRCEDTRYLLDLKRYVLDYLVDKIHLKESTVRSLHRDGKFYTTLDGNRVRSKPAELGVRGDGIRLWYSHRNRLERNLVVDTRDMVAWYSHDNLFAHNEGRRSRYSIHFMFANNATNTNRINVGFFVNF